ncbi:MAG: S1 family peptidase [Oscillospiraceae bacterium]|nr:S1 family peptidase [Oscillospiraceae bacterium]
MKRKFSILLIVTLLVATIGMSVNALPSESIAFKGGFGTEQEIFSAWGEFSEQEQEDYAGVYLDDDGNVVLMFVQNSESLMRSAAKNNEKRNTLKSKDGRLEQPLVIKPAKYSYNDLLAVMGAVSKEMSMDENIRTLSLDVMNNRIEVGIQREKDDKAKTKLRENLYSIANTSLKSKSIDKDILSFYDFGEEHEIWPAMDVTGNTKVYTSFGGQFSVGVQYSRWTGSSYQPGFISCGHGVYVNDRIYVGNTQIGTVITSVVDGLCDASFIAFGSGHQFVSTVNQREELSWDVPAVNASLVQRGSVTGNVDATVVSNNFEYQGNGIYWKNLIETNKAPQLGDSGGALIRGTLDLGRTSKVIGIIHASNGVNRGYSIKGEVVERTLFY